MHSKKLKTLANVLMGYTFRGAIQANSEGEVRVIQAKNVLENNRIDQENLVRIYQQDFRTNSYVKKGDVLLTSRGVFRASAIHFSEKDILASSSVYILRPKISKILPDYLAIYLNSELGQKEIYRNLSGVAISIILRRNLEDLPILVPSLEKQQRIIDIFLNWHKRDELMHKKIKLQKNIADGAISTLLLPL